MPGFELPEGLEGFAADDSDGNGPARRAWLASLPVVVEDLARRWSLELGRPFQPGGCASWVAQAQDVGAAPLVLKVGWAHDEARHEAAGLRLWDGDGTVRLVDSLVLGHTSALLLEACEPGTALSQLVAPEEQDVVVAGLLRRLWLDPPAGHRFRPLQHMCDQWAAAFERRYETAPEPSRPDEGLARAGIELFRTLPGTSAESVLLSTDLHPENVLAARREPWLVIDPKPYVGDPTYDPLQHMLNHPDRLSADPVGFARRMADLLDLEPDRLRLWLFARCVQESLDEPDLHGVARKLAP